MSKSIAISVLWIIASQAVLARTDVRATFCLTENDSSWVLEMSLPPTGIEATMNSYLDQKLLRQLSKTEYQREIFEYAKTHFRLKVDGRVTPIEQEGLRLDNHNRLAKLKFTVPEMPKRPRLIEVYIPMFSEQSAQMNVLAIDRMESPQTRFELTPANNYRVSVAFTNGGLVETGNSQSLGLRTLTVYALVFIGLGVIFWILTKAFWTPSTDL